MKWLSNIWLFAGVALCLGLLPSPVAAAPEASADVPEATFVGGEECSMCHDEMEETLIGTAHDSEFFETIQGHGCESCHGPGSNHSEDPEAYSMRVTDLSPEEQTATCQQCHSGNEQFFWAGGTHESRGLSCLSCHSVHAPESEVAQLQEATEKEQCYSCHKDVRAQTWKRSHHPIREGRISCSDCHNAHGSTTEAMITEASINDQCYTCHAEKRGPFVWDHPPVREDCMTCHAPHGTNHTKLKIAEVPYLCQRCHSNTRHPGTLYDGTRISGGSGESNRSINRSCVNCHSSIHGSNHPSSPYLAQ